MTFPSRSVVPALAAGLGLSLLSALPAGAHGLASAGLLAGGLHPLLGLDHLLLLVGVGAAAASVEASLLLFALGGALLGACFGAFGGTLPLAELLAALAISAVGLLLLRTPGSDRRPGLVLPGSVIGMAVAIHALLHGQAATGELGWWLGAGASSVVVVLGSMACCRRLHTPWLSRLAVTLVLGGGVLALLPLG
ncbi:MAG: HupE/UreJ family protein [Cyanobium sp.]